jgi:glucose/arabinose dehydrogenase
MTTRTAAVLAAFALSGCSFDAAFTEARQGDRTCQPVETRSPNAADQRPDFPGQTRACVAPSNVAFDVTVVAKGLDHPWGVEPLPDGGFVVTERGGRMRVYSAAGLEGPPVAGLPRVDARGQGGLLDVALGPSFAADRTIFWAYTEPREGGNATSVARGRLSEDGARLDDVRVILRAQPTYEGTLHFGSRLAFGPDGLLYVTLGERSDRGMRPQAQRLDSHMGKVLRVTPDGTAPPDNPFAGRSDALPEVWTLGHRNIQAAAFDEQGRLWTIEHGTRGGDELNLIAPGTNYGWPLVAFGEEYSGSPIATATTSRAGYQGPVYYWDPVIAPSGAQFYTGDAFPAWKGSLFVGSLREQRLVRLVLTDDRVTGEEHLLAERDARIRDVRQAPDGSLYVTTDAGNGEVWRITPRR